MDEKVPAEAEKKDNSSTNENTKEEPTLISLTKEEYGTLKKAESDLKNTVTKAKFDELEREYVSVKNELTKIKIEAETNGTLGNPFEVAKSLTALTVLSTNYSLPLEIEKMSSLKEFQIAVLNSLKSKFGIDNFNVDLGGNLEMQIKNLELSVHQSNFYKQTNAFKEKHENRVINNTIGKKLFSKGGN